MENNTVEFCVYGDYALFSDPITRVGGEKWSYPVPTYGALKGVLASVYWKPTIIWFIDEVRIMNPIQTEVKGIRPINYHQGGNDLAYYTYLKECEYQVRAHFEFNTNRPEFAKDRNVAKHIDIANRMIRRGGRRDIFLGTRECQAYVEPCEFGAGEGFYDNIEERSFGPMFHGYTYPEEAYDKKSQGKLIQEFWTPVMRKGVIKFCRPEECIHRTLHDLSMKKFETDKEGGAVWE